MSTVDIVDWLIAYDSHPARKPEIESRISDAVREIITLRERLIDAEHRLQTIHKTASVD